MPLWLAIVLFVAFCVAVAVVLFSHKHRWSAWDAPVARTSGRVTQSRRCKDSACNRYQIKDVSR